MVSISEVSDNAAGGKIILRSDCVDVLTDLNLYCMHMPTCFLCWILAQIMLYY